MRKINEMLKLIPPDELNGGITMNRTNGTDKIKSKKTYSKEKNVKLRRGGSGLVAAALVLAVGGGALALALTRGDSVKPSTGAESITAAAGQDRFEADIAADKLYKLINANIAAHVEDGFLSQVVTGAHTVDLSALDSSLKNMFARSLDPDKFRYQATRDHFAKATEGLTDIPESGQVFYYIGENYKLKLVQYRAAEGTAAGQFSEDNCARTEFGVLPEDLGKQNSTDIDLEKSIHAHAFYDIIDRMQKDYNFGDYPVNQQWSLLPPGSLVVLDLDDPDQYADFIYRMEEYNTEKVEFTGKLFFDIEYGNAPNYVAWQPAGGGLMEVVSDRVSDGAWNGGDISDKAAAWALNDVFIGSSLINSSAASTIGCERYIPHPGGILQGVITDRSNMPEVFEWYEDFLARNYEPVAFDPDKLISIADIEKVIKYEWTDFEKKEPVIIRTSDMEGANIYVNGRYYNVEDTSVLELLENGMPTAVRRSSSDSTKPEAAN